MKKTITLLVCLLSIFFNHSFGQIDIRTVRTQDIDQMKIDGKLNGKEQYVNYQADPSPVRLAPNNANSTATAGGCNCWVPRDATWQIGQFDGSGGSGGPGVAPDYRNDDWSTVQLALPFNFCFYGANVTAVYLNNNGSVSVGAAYSTFTADSFPSPNYVMIAPFWGDVDTRGALSGLVYYQITSTHMIVQWENVGYFGIHDDKLNSFQLILTNGADPLLPPNSNVSFCYQDMQWTTGDASGGSGGFGGTPATVGINQGNGTDYIQLGRFDAPGTQYDGPYGAADGVDMLDNQQFILNACNSGSNIPPILNSVQVCDTITVCENDTVLITGTFLSPELSQQTSVSVQSLMTGISVIQNVPGVSVDFIVQVVGLASNMGMNRFDLVATDNGTPVRSVRIPVVVNVINEPVASYTFTPTGTINVGTTVTFTNTSTDLLPGVIYTWDFGDGTPTSSLQDPTHTFNTGGTFDVTLTVTNPGGCTTTYTQQISVFTCAVAALTVADACINSPTTVTFTGVSIASATFTWDFAGGTVLSGSGIGPYSVQWSTPGNYQVAVSVDLTGCTTSSATDNVDIFDQPVASFSSTAAVCAGENDPIQFTGYAPGSTSITWDFDGGIGGGTGAGPFNIVWSTAGNYTVQTIATNNGCADTSFSNIVVNAIPTSLFTATPSVCAGDPVAVNYTGSASGTANYAWDFNGATVSSGTGQGPYSMTWNTAGAYQLSLTVTENGCASTQTLAPVTINPIPTASIAATSALCVGASNAISFNGSASAGATFNWNFGAGTVVSGSGAGPYSVQWNAAATDQVSLTVTDAGCTNSTTFNVTINPIPNSLFTATPSVCTGDNVTLTYTGSASAGANYVWDFNGGTSGGGSQGPFTVTWNTPGTYNVSLIVTENGCTSIQTSNAVVNNPIPDAQISATPGLCIGEQNTISYSGTAVAGATYNWTFGTGTVVSGSGAGPYNVQWAAAGNETVNVTVTQSGCTDNASYSVIVNAIPTSLFNLPPSICAGEPFDVNYTGTSGNAANFIWDFGTATVVSGSGAGPYSLVSDVAGSPAISLEVNENGCVSPTTIQNIIIAPIPVVDAGDDVAVCSGTVVPLGGTPEASTVYSWNPTSGIDNPNSSNPNITLDNSGTGTIQTTYYLTATSSYGCVNQDTIILGAYAIPYAEFPTPPAQCLDSNSFNFIPVGNIFPGVSYSWDFSSASDIGTSALQIPPAVRFSSVGFHPIILNTSYNGCPGVPYVDQIEILEMPDANFDPVVINGCAPLLVPFSNLSSSNSASFQWSFSDGGSDTLPFPNHVFVDAGIYSVTLIASTARGCASTLAKDKIIEVYPVPQAAFIPNPEIATIYEPIIHFQNTTVNGAYYQWTFGDSSGTSQTSPYHTYNAVGAYEIILMTESDHGCRDTTRGVIRIEYGYSFFVPDAFTPNGDGVNDYFQGYGTFVKDYELLIFNRWGVQVFKSNNYDVPWDGKVDKEVQNDVYVYKIKVTDLKNEVHSYIGKVSVIR
ncbi:MAG: PKD domain-containing protein [Bacteroidetes bacterium]|nr:PKD domain-containing protein [Bacteroidota bacterium]